MNCSRCGKRLSRMEIRKYRDEETGHPICSNCRKEQLKEKVRKASPSQLEILKANPDDGPLIEEILKEHVTQEPQPKRGPYTLPPKIEKCGPGEILDVETGKCVKLPERPSEALHDALHEQQVYVPHQPAPEVPIQPVTTVGPVTVEQKIEVLEQEIQGIKIEIANIQGQLERLGKHLWERLKL